MTKLPQAPHKLASPSLPLPSARGAWGQRAPSAGNTERGGRRGHLSPTVSPPAPHTPHARSVPPAPDQAGLFHGVKRNPPRRERRKHTLPPTLA